MPEDDYISEELKRLEVLGLKRRLRLVEGPQGPRVSIDGRVVTLLCSNDYLGLANNPLVVKAAAEALKNYGLGAGASRLISGGMEEHVRLEEAIREFKGSEAAVVFNSGYHANIGCITTLAGRGTEIFSDRLNHASIIDGCVLSRAKVTRYVPRDMDSLERALKRSKARKKLVITEGVFSMDGTIAPLKDILFLADRHSALVYLDDAHATGVLGKSGRGTVEHFSLSHPSVIEMGTFGKAFGSAGAFITGRRELIGLLISKARPLIYSTALPPCVCAGARKAVELSCAMPELRQRLWENVDFLRKGLKGLGLDAMDSSSHIMPVLVGEAKKTMGLSERLLEKGVFIHGIRPPTVPKGTSRLRITLTAGHDRQDLESALSAIGSAFTEAGLL